MADLTPEAILESVFAAYRGFSEYEDTGMVLEDHLGVVSFRTRFQRSHLFEFSYADIDDDGKEQFRASVVVRDGQVNLESVLKDVPPLESLRFAVAALAGISRGSAHGAASLLLEEVGGWLPTTLLKPIRLPDKLVREVDCYHVRGAHPRVPGDWSLVVEKRTWLIRQRIAHHKAPTITDYETCRGR